MIYKILSIFLLTSSLVQNVYSIRPDISFTGDNDRFDLSAMMNPHYRGAPAADDDDDSEVASDVDYRRQLRTRDTEVPSEDLNALSDEPKKAPPPAIGTRRADDDDNFAVDDRMNSFEGGTASDFEENLKQFRFKYVKPPSRRNIPHDVKQVEYEVFMKNAFPIVMKVDGYLKAPLV